MQLTLALSLIALAASHGSDEATPSPAELRIARARAALEAEPENARQHAALAFAYSRRARETADPAWYDASLESVARALELQPDLYAARRVEAWVTLGKHEFARGLELARALQKRFPDDVEAYGLVVDGSMELGLYEEAEEACQWMLDLRPGNVPGLTRAAYLRELFGDIGGAIELMHSAFHSTDTREREDRAWILTHLGHLERLRGRHEAAQQVLDGALGLFPEYHYSLAQYGMLRADQGRWGEAAELFERRFAAAPHPENRLDWAEALLHAGDAEAAAVHFESFQAEALNESGNRDNANRELARFWMREEFAPYRGAHGPAEALALLREETGHRADVHTRALLAEAFLRTGDLDRAVSEIDVVLAVGVTEFEILTLGARIAAAAGDAEAARDRYESALATNPSHRGAEGVRGQLEDLPAPEDGR